MNPDDPTTTGDFQPTPPPEPETGAATTEVGIPTPQLNPEMTGDYQPDPNAGTATHPKRRPGGLPANVTIPGYELLKELGRGGMGVVYQARQIKADRLVALKLMLNPDHAGSSARDRFDVEAQAVARLQHPNIVQVFEVGETAGLPFFTLEFVAGGTLHQQLRENLPEPAEAASLLITLARAMHYAHTNNVIHRDLKPVNILMTPAGVPKLTDFGLARKLEDDTERTAAGAILGTPSYMAPEQAAGDNAAIGPPADIYGLGAILYEVLTGRPPFKGGNVWEVIRLVRTADPIAPHLLRPGIPRDLETVCLKCLAKDPAKRYATAEALAEDLTRFLAGKPTLARPAGPLERAIRWSRRNPWPTVALVASLFVALCAIYAAVRFNADARSIAEKQKLAEGRLTKY
ncbi:MAG: serine/threonine-protein kinase, partial [Gemmataceae bacterium]